MTRFDYQSLALAPILLKDTVGNDINSLNNCIELIMSDDCRYNATKCFDLLCNMIVSNDNSIVTHSKMRDAILGDYDKGLKVFLTAMLRRQGIENIQSYHENGIITFEFIFNLLKLCINNDGGENCSTLLRHWLQIIVKYHCKSPGCHHNYSQMDTNSNRNPDDWMCILCSNIITIATTNNDSKKQDYDYCACCDYLVCQNCANVDEYHIKRVQLFNCLLFC